MDERIGIAEAVDFLRAEFAAAAAGGGAGPRFEVGPVELEFSVEMRREGRGRTGVKAWVVSAGAEGSVSRASVHRVRLVLTPKETGADGTYTAYHVNTDEPDTTGETLGSRFGG
ncbi:trypco2 family protein [Streptomyces sp. NPDC004549]|uniref:trypco2 family protein n=1 Tax=Streptomyces sp. NPDC004549 TaxID=3154283 RepID=UPI0033B0C043